MIKERIVSLRFNKRVLAVLKIMYQDYHPSEIKLANEIAEVLKDRDSLALHLQYARRYKEEFLRKVLNKVMSLPENKIRRSRAALYTFLINQNSRNGDVGH
jgi:hypothetical protein